MAKEFFTQNNVSYTERDVAQEASARDDMIKRSGQMGVPVIDVDGQLVIGFDKEKLAQLLGVGA